MRGGSKQESIKKIHAESEGKTMILSTFIKDCNKLIAEYNDGKSNSYPHWKDHVLLPLAREIGLRLNMQYEVSGVFGLRFECYITIFDDNNRYTLCTTPKFKAVSPELVERATKCDDFHAMNEIEWINYDTGDDTQPHDANGFGRTIQSLPDNVEEIIAILKEADTK